VGWVGRQKVKPKDKVLPIVVLSSDEDGSQPRWRRREFASATINFDNFMID
jgi:hypothetical protein